MAGDPLYNNRVLGLHFSGADNSTVFVDNSPNANTVTPVGNTKIIGGEGALDGNGDYLSVAHTALFNLAAADFTLELAVKFNTVPGAGNYCALFTKAADFSADYSYGLWFGGAANQKFYFEYTLDGVTRNFKTNLTTFQPTPGVKYRLALVRNGSALDLFIEGVKQNTESMGTHNIYSSTVPVFIGAVRSNNPGYFFDGTLDEVYLYTGVAKYDSDYTPLDQPIPDFLPPVSTTDDFYNDTLISLHCSGPNNSTGFTDTSVYPKTVTANGNARISTTVTDPFGGNSGVAVFDGSGDWLAFPIEDTGFHFGKADFCIDFFYYPIATTDFGRVLQFSNGDTFNALSLTHFGTDATKLAINVAYTNTAWLAESITGTLVLNTWNFIQLRRANGVLRYYINNVQQGTALSIPGSLFYRSDAIAVIGGQSTPDRSINGYISQLRITRKDRGILARPTGPFPDVQSTPTPVLRAFNGTIQESLAIDKFFVRGYNSSNGVLVGSAETTTAGFTFNLADSDDDVYIAAIPDQGSRWKPSTLYAVGAKVYPVDRSTKPYYYRRLTAGTSGSVEPVWPVTIGGQVADGVVDPAWEMVAELTHPIMRGPLSVN